MYSYGAKLYDVSRVFIKNLGEKVCFYYQALPMSRTLFNWQ